MESISHCMKIHLLFLFHKYPLSELNLTGDYYDSWRSESYLRKLTELKFQPFLISVQKLSTNLETSFKSEAHTKLLQVI